MADFLALKQSGRFWDNTENLPTLLDDDAGLLLNNTAGKGGSTLLSLLRYYMDQSLADPAYFSDLVMGKDPHFEDFLGKYRTFSLDFSDYRAATLEETVDYLYRKAEDLYRWNVDLFYPDFPLYLAEKAVGIHYRTLDPLSLAAAFSTLCGRAKHNGQQTLLLIDNAVLLELPIEDVGWDTAKPHWKLLWELFPERMHDDCDILVMVNSLEERHHSSLRYTCWDFNLDAREFDDQYNLPQAPHAVPQAHRYAIPEPPPAPDPQPPEPFEDWDAFYEKLKRMVDEENVRRAWEAAIAEEKERRRYLLPPPKDFPQISPHLGARSFSIPTNTPQYQERNKLLKKLYRRHFKSENALYQAMQNLDTKRRTDLPPHTWDEREHDPLQEALIAPAEALGWHVWPNHDQGPYLKAYFSFTGGAVRQPLLELTLYLVQNAQKDFALKASRFVRDGPICCWVRPSDIPVLRTYAQQHAEALTQPLPFVPYWNGIGLTRELIHRSYNGTIANLFFQYFSTVSDGRRVSLAEMLDRYAQNWCVYNRKNDWTRDDALTFLLVLDSFSILLADLKPEDSVLFTPDKDAYGVLERAKCWNDLEEYRP